MYQSIALTPESMMTFQENWEKFSDAVKYLSKEEEILVKPDFNVNIIQMIEKLEDKQISALYSNSLFPVFNRLKKIIPNISNKINGIKNKDDLCSLGLAGQSKDKILISHKEELKLILKMNNLEIDIHVCNANNYVSPTKEDRITNPRMLSDINDGEEINPNLVLFPYIKLSNRIEILDPYPPVFRTKSGVVVALPIWKDMVKSCNANTTIIFTTVSDFARGDKVGSKNYNISEEEISNALLSDQPQNIHIKIVFSKNILKARTIKTDQFYILIEHGLGLFKKTNDGKYINNSGDGASIVITHIGR